MKKTKLLTSVSTLSIASAIFPITTTACKEEKNDIDKMHWSNEGDYNSAMTNNEFKAEFIKNNPVGQGDIPTDIYDNVDFAINGSLANWTITLTATEKSKEYKGSVTIDITAKINVVSLEWSTEGYYWGLMTKGAILGQFKQSNEPGDHNLPLDVYDNVDVNNDDPESKWIINIKANSSSNTYVGELKLTLGFSGSIFYDDKEYFVAENIDPNLFLTFDGNNYTTQNIPLADGKTITIGGSEENWKKLTSVQINNFDTTKIIGDYFLSGCTNLKYLVLPDINNVETIGDNALFNCESLWDIDLLWLSNVTTIKNNFLNKCSKIKNIDLSTL